MQISVKTPPELTLRILERCAVLDEPYPSSLASQCVWQCLTRMDHPHGPFRPLPVVEKYFHAVGRHEELFPPAKKETDGLLRQLTEKERVKRADEAARRLKEFRDKLRKEAPPKHLHLKISEGGIDLVSKIRARVDWLRLKPNAFVVACLRDCLEAMDDPKKAWLPPQIVVDFWTTSKAHLRPKPDDAIGAMVRESQEGMLRERAIPIMDTLIRFALKEEWDTSLKQILRDAGVFPEDEKARAKSSFPAGKKPNP